MPSDSSIGGPFTVGERVHVLDQGDTVMATGEIVGDSYDEAEDAWFYDVATDHGSRYHDLNEMELVPEEADA